MLQNVNWPNLNGLRFGIISIWICQSIRDCQWFTMNHCFTIASPLFHPCFTIVSPLFHPWFSPVVSYDSPSGPHEIPGAQDLMPEAQREGRLLSFSIQLSNTTDALRQNGKCLRLISSYFRKIWVNTVNTLRMRVFWLSLRISLVWCGLSFADVV